MGCWSSGVLGDVGSVMCDLRYGIQNIWSIGVTGYWSNGGCGICDVRYEIDDMRSEKLI